MAEPHHEEIEKLEALYAENPEGRVFTHLAEAYRRAGEPERAREIVEAGLKKHADYSSAHVVMGRILMDQRQNEAAAASFRRVIELDPHNLVALKELGNLARQDGRVDEAVEYYRELLALDPTQQELSEYVAAHTEPEAGQAAAETPAFGTPSLGTVESAAPLEDEPGLLDLGEITGFGPTPEAASGSELGGFGSLSLDEPPGALAGEEPSELAGESEAAGETESGEDSGSEGFWSAVGWGPEPGNTWDDLGDQGLTPDWTATETGAETPDAGAGAARETGTPPDGVEPGFEDRSGAAEEGPADLSMASGWTVEGWESEETGTDQTWGETAAGDTGGWDVSADVEAEDQAGTVSADEHAADEADTAIGGETEPPMGPPQPALGEAVGFGSGAVDEPHLDAEPTTSADAGPGIENAPESEPDVWSVGGWESPGMQSEESGGAGHSDVPEGVASGAGSDGGSGSEAVSSAEPGVGESSTEAPEPEAPAPEVPEPEEPWAYTGEEPAEEELETLELTDEVHTDGGETFDGQLGATGANLEDVAASATGGEWPGSWEDPDEALMDTADLSDLSSGSRDISFSEELVPESAHVSEDESPGGPDVGAAEGEDSGAPEDEPLFLDDSAPAAGVKDEEEMVTETMADLYLRQGFHRRAVEVYRELLRQRPADTRLEAKLSEAEYKLESQGDEPAGVEGSSEDRPVEDVEAAWTGRAGAVGGSASPYAWTAEPGLEAEGAVDDVTIGDYLSELLAWQPRAGVRPVPATPTERAQPSSSREDVTAGSSPDGETDDEDLEMFRAWLQSLKH